MYSIFVTINIRPEHVEAFMEASVGDAEGSTRDEPGCFRFDMHQDAATPARFYLYEVYRDEAAFEAHLETPHFIRWRDAVTPFFDGEIEKIDMKTLFPSDEGWERQKPALLHW